VAAGCRVRSVIGVKPGALGDILYFMRFQPQPVEMGERVRMV
jgi:hypothetical protein